MYCLWFHARIHRGQSDLYHIQCDDKVLQYQEVGFSEFNTLPLKVHLRQTSPKNTQITHILTHEQCMSLHDLAHFHSTNMIYDLGNAEHYLARALLREFNAPDHSEPINGRVGVTTTVLYNTAHLLAIEPQTYKINQSCSLFWGTVMSLRKTCVVLPL